MESITRKSLHSYLVSCHEQMSILCYVDYTEVNESINQPKSKKKGESEYELSDEMDVRNDIRVENGQQWILQKCAHTENEEQHCTQSKTLRKEKEMRTECQTSANSRPDNFAPFAKSVSKIG